MDRKDMPAAPPLPPGCVDFNALHEAAVSGASAEEALGAALAFPEQEQAVHDAITDALEDGVLAEPPAPRGPRTARAKAANAEPLTHAPAETGAATEEE